VSRPRLEVADVFHHHGAARRRANAGHLSLGQLQVMSAVEHCRSAALGGHVERCQNCGHSRISYNSCRNRHCPKCQGAAAKDWLAAREADLPPVGYFHPVFTLPAEIAPTAYQNKAVVYDLLLRAASETLLSRRAHRRPGSADSGRSPDDDRWAQVDPKPSFVARDCDDKECPERLQTHSSTVGLARMGISFCPGFRQIEDLATPRAVAVLFSENCTVRSRPPVQSTRKGKNHLRRLARVEWSRPEYAAAEPSLSSPRRAHCAG
jgi:hypothetical protein